MTAFLKYTKLALIDFLKDNLLMPDGIYVASFGIRLSFELSLTIIRQEVGKNAMKYLRS